MHKEFELRILGFKNVLQYRTKTRWIVGSSCYGWSEWKDVPKVEYKDK